MLHFFRQKNIRRNVLWAISGIIIISFGFGFGISNYSGTFSLTDAAGKVFGRNVSIKEYKNYYAATTDQAILMHGENYKKILPFIDMDNETWTRILLIKEAERRHIQVSDGEVIANIQGFPFFHRDGGFSQELYQTILRYLFQREARQFEEGIRDQIKVMKLLRSETGSINVPDEMVRKEYERRNQRTQVSYVLIDPKNFLKDVSVNNAAIQAHYDAHREEFLTPDAVKVSYMTLRLGEKATDEEKTSARSKANILSQKLAQGANFDETAKAEGLVVKETDFFSIDNPDITQGWSLDFLQKIFEAKKGDILPPTDAIAGIQILKVTDLKPAAILTFEEAKPLVTQQIMSEKASELAKAQGTELVTSFEQKLAQGMTFDLAASDLKLETKKTPFLIQGDYIPEIGISSDFQDATAELTKDKRLSKVVMTAKGPVIIYWEASQPLDEKKFEEVKKDFATTLFEEQRVSTMNKVIKDIREKAKLENYLDKPKKQGKRL
ncbi:MAG: SurA N-terminal domain-containing protein [Candidatus Omnitrophica bacterium]|nr:SurA N-terminal domain-containing protein [Candidatus Omnitrophota bacterium]